MQSERSSVLDFSATDMRRYLCAALLGLAASVSSANPLAITNVRIIDGNGGVPIEQGTVVVDGQRFFGKDRVDWIADICRAGG